MRATLIAASLILLACTVRGQELTGQNEAGTQEAVRRGDHLEELGSAQAEGPASYAASALAPPEDDSDHWFLCVVTSKDPKYARRCDQLLTDFSRSIDLRAWADTENPKQSWALFDTRDIDDPLQADWFSSIRGQLKQNAFPAVVIQPPANEKFGSNAHTVGIIHGYNGDPADMSRRIREKIRTYANKIKPRQTVKTTSPRTAGGHAQWQPYGQRSSAPTADHLPSRDPTEWPDLQPPKPATMGYVDIRKACPKAPVAWVREQVKAGITTSDELAEAYDELLEVPPEEEDAENPPRPMSNSWEVLVLIGIVVALPMYLMWKNQRTRPGTTTRRRNDETDPHE